MVPHRLIAALSCILALCDGAVAASNPCIEAADRAGQSFDVPVGVMRAVTLAETGHAGPDGFEPWPWTIQSNGRGRWFEGPQDAIALIRARIAEGQTNFDVGCFQLNYGWHAAAFSSAEEMLDPDANAVYAAGFLSQLFAQSGDWKVAVGRFHSRNPEVAAPYVSRLKTLYDAHLERPPEPEPYGVERVSGGDDGWNGRDASAGRRTRREVPFGVARGPLIEARAQPLLGRP